jgi:hypothetical protein
MKLSLIFLVLLLHASYSKAQTLIRIIDAESRRALPQANIKDIVSQDIIVTDAAGEAVIQVQEPTSLEISFVGYQNRLVEISENQDYFLVHLIPDHITN